MHQYMRNAVKRSYQSLDSPTSPPPSTHNVLVTQRAMTEDNPEPPDQIDPSDVPPCELFGNLNQGMCGAHASSLSPQTSLTTFDELSHLSKASGPQNLRQRNFPTLQEEKTASYTVLNAKTKFDQTSCRITALAFNDNDELIVADAGNSKVKVFSSEGQLKVECSIPPNMGSLVEPSGVAYANNGEIVVTDRHQGNIKVFTKDGHFLTSFGNDLKQPCDVVLNKNGNVIVVTEVSRKIFLYKKIGDDEYTKLSGNVKDMTIGNGPRCVTCTTNGTLVITDENAGCILTYDQAGQLEGLYRAEGPRGGARRPQSLVSSYNLGQVKRPAGVASDHQGGVLVADPGGGRVSLFDVSSNTFTRQVLSREDGVEAPQRIAVSPGGKMALLETKCDTLKIYDLKTL